MMSAASSIPTEMRTIPSVKPISLRPPSPRAAWVIVAGCEIRDSTPPNYSPSEQTRTLRNIFLALLSEPVSKVIIDPKPFIWRLARACWG